MVICGPQNKTKMVECPAVGVFRGVQNANGKHISSEQDDFVETEEEELPLLWLILRWINYFTHLFWLFIKSFRFDNAKTPQLLFIKQ